MFTYTTRKDGRLMKRVSVNGKIKTLYANNPKELEKLYIIEKNKDVTNQEDLQSITFKKYAESWLEINSKGKSEATVKEYKYILNKYLIEYFGNKKIDRIKRIDVQEMQSDLLENNHIELAHKCIRFMKTICDDAIANDYLSKNPCFRY